MVELTRADIECRQGDVKVDGVDKGKVGSVLFYGSDGVVAEFDGLYTIEFGIDGQKTLHTRRSLDFSRNEVFLYHANRYDKRLYVPASMVGFELDNSDSRIDPPRGFREGNCIVWRDTYVFRPAFAKVADGTHVFWDGNKVWCNDGLVYFEVIAKTELTDKFKAAKALRDKIAETHKVFLDASDLASILTYYDLTERNEPREEWESLLKNV